jgi:hypothetical protein
MSQQYFVDIGGKTMGPLDLDQVQKLYSSGTVSDQTLYTQPGASDWLPVSMLTPLFPAACAIPPVQPTQPVKPLVPRSYWYCPQCGHLGPAGKQTQGSILIELVLWLCFILPGLIYSLWRLTSRPRACSSCGTCGIIPVTSPKARSVCDVRPPWKWWVKLSIAAVVALIGLLLLGWLAH